MPQKITTACINYPGVRSISKLLLRVRREAEDDIVNYDILNEHIQDITGFYPVTYDVNGC